MSASQLRAKAREILQGKWGKGALITLSFALTIYIINLVLMAIPILGAIASVIISLPLSYGIMTSFIKLKREEELKYTSFIKEAYNKFKKVWCVYGQIIKKMLVPIIIVVICYIIMTIGATGIVLKAFSGNYSNIDALGILTVIASIVCFIFGIYCTIKGLLYILSMVILYDKPEMQTKEIVEESERLMKGNRLKYIWLELTFIGWFLLIPFTFGIGALWLIPYVTVSIICFYENLAGKDSTLEPEVIEEESNPISNNY